MSGLERPEDVLAEKQLTKDERDVTELAGSLAQWLTEQLESDGPVEVVDVRAPSGSGMSSLTLLLDCRWSRAGSDLERTLVARVAPSDTAYPVFPSYDLAMQYDVMAGVAAHSDVPVPHMVGMEPTGSLIGSPFLVMEKVDGRAPLDNPPYVFGGWLLDATPEERARLEEATLGVIAGIAGITEPRAVFTRLAKMTGEDSLRSHFDALAAYYSWTHRTDGIRIPLLERAFAQLEEQWPSDPGDAVLSWGDARPGNVLYDGFEPVAVLDWEMAALGPRELDIGWYVFLHRFFQDIAEVFELPGMPDFADPVTVATTYERLSGHAVRDLDWYVLYAATRQGVIMSQVKRRMVHFGEEQTPDEPDDFVMHRAAIERMLGA